MDKPIEFFAQTAESLSNGKGGSIDPAFKFRRGLKYYFVNFAKENSHHLSLGVNLVPAWFNADSVGVAPGFRFESNKKIPKQIDLLVEN